MHTSLPSFLIGRGHLTRILTNRLTTYNLAQNARFSLSDAQDASESTLRWFREALSSRKPDNVDGHLTQMCRRYTETHEPLAYILETQPFGELELDVKRPILIPRPETEEWAVHLCDVLLSHLSQGHLRRPFRILDVCCGSGCIGLLLAKRLAKYSVKVVGVDISARAIELSEQNKGKEDIHNISFRQADIFSDDFVASICSTDRQKKFDLLVSNPPYIAPSDYDSLDASVKLYEDRRALVGSRGHPEAQDEAGLAFYHRLAVLSRDILRGPTSNIVCMVTEVGKGQAEAVSRILQDTDRRTDIKDDFAGIGRSVWQYSMVT